MKLSNVFKLLRPQQYYKNLVIYLGLIFSGNLTSIENSIITTLGFVCLCLASSSNYIINDILDRREDAKNPEKKRRPIASGDVSVVAGLVLSIALLMGALMISTQLSSMFTLLIISFSALTFIYSVFLKHEVFIDIITIAINFVMRATAGAIIINVWISPWLITGTFFLALFLATGKRKSEQLFLGENQEHRKVLNLYSKEILDLLMYISTTLLLVCYALYSFLGFHKVLLTLPIVTYIILRYLHLIYSGRKEGRFLHLAVRDKRIMVAVGIYLLVLLYLLY